MKRFTHNAYYDSDTMDEDPRGDWVRHEDHEAGIAALRDALDMRIEYRQCTDCCRDMRRHGHAESCAHYKTEKGEG